MAVNSSDDEALETARMRTFALRRESVRLALLLVGPPESGYAQPHATAGAAGPAFTSFDREGDLLEVTSPEAPSVHPKPV